MVENSEDSRTWPNSAIWPLLPGTFSPPTLQLQLQFKEVGIRAGYVVAYVDTTASFRSKMRIEKVGGNRVGTVVNSLR